MKNRMILVLLLICWNLLRGSFKKYTALTVAGLYASSLTYSVASKLKLTDQSHTLLMSGAIGLATVAGSLLFHDRLLFLFAQSDYPNSDLNNKLSQSGAELKLFIHGSIINNHLFLNGVLIYSVPLNDQTLINMIVHLGEAIDLADETSIHKYNQKFLASKEILLCLKTHLLCNSKVNKSINSLSRYIVNHQDRRKIFSEILNDMNTINIKSIEQLEECIKQSITSFIKTYEIMKDKFVEFVELCKLANHDTNLSVKFKEIFEAGPEIDIQDFFNKKYESLIKHK